MIQDTTLRMVVQAVDQASAPLDAVKARVEQLDTSMGAAGRTAEDALPAIGKEAADLADNMDDLGNSAAGAATAFSGAWAEAAVVAGIAIVSFLNYMRQVAEEHERIRDLATTLELPVSVVEGYSESWLKVAQSLNEAARGYSQLSEAQSAAFKSLGLDPGNLGEASRVKTLVSLGTGTDLQKVDVLRRLFGLNDKEALAIIKEENRKFYGEAAAAGAYGVGGTDISGFRNKQGIGAGQLNVGQLLNSGRLPTPQGFENQQFADKALEDMEKSIQRTMDAAARNRADAQKDSAKAEQQIIRDNYDEQQAIVKQGLKIREQEEKAVVAAIKENDKQIAQAGKNAWDNVNDSTRASLKAMEVPVNDFVEAWKDSMKDMVYFGDFSFKRLIARIIVQLTSKELFSAIDKVGEALSTAMSGSSGKGGFFSAAASFVGGLFSGKAGGGRASGWELVGEEGPELAYFGAGGRVINSRQAAFLGGGQAAQQSPTVVNHNTYNISGVETQQVIAYVERSRREDQRANLRMLERNGLGRMR